MRNKISFNRHINNTIFFSFTQDQTHASIHEDWYYFSFSDLVCGLPHSTCGQLPEDELSWSVTMFSTARWVFLFRCWQASECIVVCFITGWRHIWQAETNFFSSSSLILVPHETLCYFHEWSTSMLSRHWRHRQYMTSYKCLCKQCFNSCVFWYFYICSWLYCILLQ
jgi:hypothetical protein